MECPIFQKMPPSTDRDNSEIVEFYSGKNIFITGASGYVGTLLVEKLLRTCKSINTLYLLFRSKRNQDINNRVKEYFNDEVFTRMKLENPNYYKQVQIVPGDLLGDNFDLNKEDEERLTREINIIFHVAATVKFDEHIREANKINVNGTRSVLNLAERMPHLQSFVYVSTAYSNCDLKHIEERVYSPLYTESELGHLLDSCSDEQLAILTEHILGAKPNTYTLTKSIAEHLLDEKKAILPISIIRPSIILPTLTEPMPLYYKGLTLLLALFSGVGVGVIRVLKVDVSLGMDIVPGDRTINAILAVGWNTAMKSRPKDQVVVFNFIGSNDNPSKIKAAGDLSLDAFRKWKENCTSIIWKSHLCYTKQPFCYFILFFFLHLLPCVVFVPLETRFQKESRLLKTYRRLWFLRDTFAYFNINEWTFVNDNTKCLIEKLNNRDKQLFDFTLTNFHWTEIFSFLPRSISRYTLKDQFTKEKYKKKMIYIDRFELVVSWIAWIGFAYVVCYMLATLLNRLSQNTF